MTDEPVSGAGASGARGSGDAGSKAQAVAVALMVITGIGMALQVFGLVMNVLGAGMSMAGAGRQNELLVSMMSGGIGSVMNVIGLAVGAFVFYGLRQMRQLEKYGLSLAAVIVGMVPCLGPCWCLGLPLGVWGLVVLLDQQVKAAFRS
jgi:hypothetical protein